MRMSSVIRYIFLPPAPRSTFTLGTSVALPPAPPAPCPPDAARAAGADFAGWDPAGAAASSRAPIVTIVSRVAFDIYLACPCWGAAGPASSRGRLLGRPLARARFRFLLALQALLLLDDLVLRLGQIAVGRVPRRDRGPHHLLVLLQIRDGRVRLGEPGLQLGRLLQDRRRLTEVLGDQVLRAQVVPHDRVVGAGFGRLLQQLDGARRVLLVDLEKSQHLVDVATLGVGRAVGLHHLPQLLHPLVLAELVVGLRHDQHGGRVALVLVQGGLDGRDGRFVSAGAESLLGGLGLRGGDDGRRRLALLARRRRRIRGGLRLRGPGKHGARTGQRAGEKQAARRGQPGESGANHGASNPTRSSLMNGNSSGRYLDRFSRAVFTYSFVTPICDARDSVSFHRFFASSSTGVTNCRMASLYWLSTMPQSSGFALQACLDSFFSSGGGLSAAFSGFCANS